MNCFNNNTGLVSKANLMLAQMKEASNISPLRDGAGGDLDSGRGDSDPGVSSPYEQGMVSLFKDEQIQLVELAHFT